MRIIIIHMITQMRRNASGFAALRSDGWHGSVSQRTVPETGLLYFLYCDAVSDTARTFRTATGDRSRSDDDEVCANGGTFALALGLDNENVIRSKKQEFALR